MATIEPSPVIDGVVIVRPEVRGDERGGVEVKTSASRVTTSLQ